MVVIPLRIAGGAATKQPKRRKLFQKPMYVKRI